MDTLHDPSGNLPDPQAATPYFRVAESRRRALDRAAAERGLTPEPWAA